VFIRLFMKLGIAAVVLVGLLFLYVRKSCACTVKWKAYRASMKTDLRNLADAEGAYFMRHGRFVDGAASYVDGSPVPLANTEFTPSTGVTVVVTVTPPPDQGWTAVASHNYTDVTCRATGDTSNVRWPGTSTFRVLEPTCSR
jgi:hypothetical protein